ncbi:MAG: hypothetical protein HW416_1852 [Chloroflexi bacterium]|nr:hypothetical protein [Chloroflexota bacterium]
MAQTIAPKSVTDEYEDSLQRSEGRVQPYEQWKIDQGLPSYRGMWVENLFDLKLAPW